MTNSHAPVGLGCPSADDERFSLKLVVTPRHGYHLFWLHFCDEPVAYMKVATEEIDGELVLDLHDIEVREGWRGHGLSKVIRERALGMTDAVRLIHTGEYTPDGFERLAGRLPRCGVPGFDHPAYKPMSFVLDWNGLRPKYS